jgi:hypothetical protein
MQQQDFGPKEVVVGRAAPPPGTSYEYRYTV